MQIVATYIGSVLAFLAIDFIGLSYMIRPVFDRYIGSLLLDSPRYGPALAFYLFYVVGLMVFVSLPALREDWSLLRVAGLGALLGAVAYGTYEFSNYATLKGWDWRMVALDLTWGTVLTATVAVIGVLVGRIFAPG
jgi:uncharacterized membrane protein